MRYARARWPAPRCYINDGRLEIDNNAAERTLRGVAQGRKNYLFAGSDQVDDPPPPTPSSRPSRVGHRTLTFYRMGEPRRPTA